LIHSIGQTHAKPLNPWIERRIFPGAYPPTLGQIVGILEPNDLAVLDVENLRLHYAMTLKHWHNRFEAAVDKVTDQFDEAFVRMWRLYLVGSMVAFESGSLHLFQVLFSRDCNNEIPWTRSEIYQKHFE
jgi:cyclopropane-fatty-acyl-phospholipid synthase